MRRSPSTRMLGAGAMLMLMLPGQLLGQAVTDPFRPPSSLTTQAPSPATPETLSDSAPLVLQATRIGGRTRHAVINGRTVQTGDRINDFEVLSISAAAVRLRRDDEEFVLQFPRDGVDKRPAAKRE